MSEQTLTPIQEQADSSDLLSQPLARVLALDWEKIAYLVFIILAIVTRFWGLGERVMSHDESLHTQFSYQFYNGEGYAHTPLMHGPFLFHITAVFYWLFGATDLSARIPVAIFGVILVAMPYLLRRRIGRIGALFASFIFLISPYVTYYSRYIRHDVYVIVWALIVVVATWYYLRERKEKYLWWFTAGMVLMFATKEVAFIYVAIFGSFLVLRLLGQIAVAPWMQEMWPQLRSALAVTAVGILLLGAGLAIQQAREGNGETAATATATDEGFAADPGAAQPVETGEEGSDPWGWVQVAGIAIFSIGLFLGIREMRPFIDEYPEFDLIILYATLLLPLASPLLTTLVGWNPRDYSFNTCMLQGQETMPALQLIIARLTQPACIDGYLSSGMFHSGLFLIITLVAGALVGLWWNRRRWVIAAVIFHVIFAILYTSVFTNFDGWFSGTVGSLGYWLEQQGVQRGSQPWFYYFFVMPFYEFLAVLFSFLGIRLWIHKQRIQHAVGYWFSALLLALLSFSLIRWLYSSAIQAPQDTGAPPPPTALGLTTGAWIGLIAAALVLGGAILFWFFTWRRRAAGEETPSFRELLEPERLFGFVPFLAWWLLLTWVAYSYAGEKMPWLSIHFVIPMAFLSGWYFQQKLGALGREVWRQRSTWLLLGMTTLLMVAVFLVIRPLWLGKIQFGSQRLLDLKQMGQFLGLLIVALGVLMLWRRVRAQTRPEIHHPITLLSLFILLSLLTARFAYLASFPNADSTTEFLVYAHGAPATKATVMEQVEELSLRMHGDKGIRVAFSSDVSWPFTWYLRDYPNRVFYGENPTQSLNDSPVVIVGRNDWNKTEPYLRDNYEYRTYTFLWWPMEEYRRISWNAILGDPLAPAAERRGLGHPGAREALWNIFFYRDYAKYQEVFGGAYTPSQWPLRHELRFYVRKDVLANLWDYGAGAALVQPPVDPYAEGELTPSPILTLNESGVAGAGEGQFSAPRNLAVGPNGRIFVADSGNHRIQVFTETGEFITTWGEFGPGPGQFNEPWGIVADDSFVYVADTWNHRIQKFTHEGEFVAAFGQNGNPNDVDGQGLGLFFGPRDLLLIGENQLLVTDTGNHRMQLMTRDGEFLQQVGGFGNQLGQLNEPVGLAQESNGNVLVADTWNGRIQQFDPALFPIGQWPVEAWEGQSINNKPYLATDSAGRVYTTDPENFRVLIFNAEGEYLARFGQFGSDSGGLGLPTGIAIDAQNNIYVADAGNNRVLKYAPIFAAPAEEEPVEEIENEEMEEVEEEPAVSPTPTE